LGPPCPSGIILFYFNEKSLESLKRIKHAQTWERGPPSAAADIFYNQNVKTRLLGKVSKTNNSQKCNPYIAHVLGGNVKYIAKDIRQNMEPRS
jgi:hypothetical protein